MVSSTDEGLGCHATELSDAGRALLLGLVDIGGRCRFQPAGDSPPALSVFEERTLAVVLSLEDEQLIRVDRDASELIWLPGDRVRIATITVELTAAGHAAVQIEARERRAASPDDEDGS
jgi:hypothetical protein